MDSIIFIFKYFPVFELGLSELLRKKVSSICLFDSLKDLEFYPDSDHLNIFYFHQNNFNEAYEQLYSNEQFTKIDRNFIRFNLIVSKLADQSIIRNHEFHCILSENDSLNSYLTALDACIDNACYISPNVNSINRNNKNEEFIRLFSPRELDVLSFICEGLSTKEISSRLNISEFTVNNHRAHLLSKSGARNSSQLVKMFTNSSK